MNPQVRILLDDLIATGRPSSRTLPLPDGRRNFDDLFASLSESDPSVSVRTIAVPGRGGDIPLHVYDAAGARPRRITLFFHGGGWVFGGREAYDGTCRLLAAKSDTAIAFVEYRLAPEHPFPAAVDDATAVLDWVREQGGGHGFDPNGVAVMGDSSGATVALGALLRARDRGDPLPHVVVLAYPALDPGMSTDSFRAFADDDFLSRDEMEWYWRQYLGPDGDPGDPLAAPATASDLAGLPRMMVIIADNDVLRDEGEAFADRLRLAGVPVAATRYEGMPHGFLVMTRYLDGAREAIRDASAALSRAAAPTEAGRT
jgi:acetyl esterase/lipase